MTVNHEITQSEPKPMAFRVGSRKDQRMVIRCRQVQDGRLKGSRVKEEKKVGLFRYFKVEH